MFEYILSGNNTFDYAGSLVQDLQMPQIHQSEHVETFLNRVLLEDGVGPHSH